MLLLLAPPPSPSAVQPAYMLPYLTNQCAQFTYLEAVPVPYGGLDAARSWHCRFLHAAADSAADFSGPPAVVTSYKVLRSCQRAEATESSRQGWNIKPLSCFETPAYPQRAPAVAGAPSAARLASTDLRAAVAPPTVHPCQTPAVARLICVDVQHIYISRGLLTSERIESTLLSKYGQLALQQLTQLVLCCITGPLIAAKHDNAPL
jgi:hypothetical protein